MAETKNDDRLFPLALTFERDHAPTTFPTPADFAQWREQERQFWERYAANNDQFTAAFRENSTLVRRQNEQSEEEFRTRLPDFLKTYVPSSSGFVKAAQRFSTISPAAARIGLSLFLQPNQRIPVNSQEYQQAQILLTAYHAVGDPLANRDRIEAAVVDAERLQKTESDRAVLFNEFMEKIETEFKIRFDGFEAKLALGAPRDYWESRSHNHAIAAQTARNRWRFWTIMILLLSFLAAIMLFTAVGDAISLQMEQALGLPVSTPSNHNMTLAFGSLIKRGIIFGTFFGVGIWWLRQVLRELRSHEHLAEDAAERVTMIETFSALKGAGLADTADLSPIFAALYRPAATGLVMDDGGGPMSPLDVLVKAAVSKIKT